MKIRSTPTVAVVVTVAGGLFAAPASASPAAGSLDDGQVGADGARIVDLDSGRYPADVVDLTNWSEGLPIGDSRHPTNVEQPELAAYRVDPWFTATSDCTDIHFRAAVNGVTTRGSRYPRSELREMTNSGRTKANWP